ncbi:uncharacterized protein Dana_GF21047 [Drosophila ananassae]|uniref:Hyaluronan/mRNA-binding protein domain-containing protein n=1 Tax=Drosophila ananassae TaxID=7217 RepID=B3MR76_DROAN|nr:uncharacterized protein LOC6503736 [Drosophila ananassae]EDV34281.1 uncharacterized protein Dana_GF21047 [Drosophila ananassae]
MYSYGGNRYQLLSFEDETQVLLSNKELRLRARKAAQAQQLQLQSTKRSKTGRKLEAKLEGKNASAAILKDSKKDNLGPKKDIPAGGKKSKPSHKKDNTPSAKSGSPNSKQDKSSPSPRRERRLFGSGAASASVRISTNATSKKLNRNYGVAGSALGHNFCLPPEMSPERKPSRSSFRGYLSGFRHRPNLDRTSRARLHDRQSGSDRTGVKAVYKRNGGGAHNWGSPKLEIQEHKKAIARSQVYGGRQPARRRRINSNSDVSLFSEPMSHHQEEPLDDSMFLTLDEWRATLKPVAAKPAGSDPRAEFFPPFRASAPFQRSGRNLRLCDIIQFNFNSIGQHCKKREFFLALVDPPDFPELPLPQPREVQNQLPPQVDDVKHFPNLS